MSLLVNVVMTCFMTGLIWFVQIVHYPLFNRVAKSSFNDYHKMHVMFTGRVVIFPMLLELIAGFHLLYYNLNTQFLFLSIINVGILIGIWMSTFLLSGSCTQSFSNTIFYKRLLLFIKNKLDSNNTLDIKVNFIIVLSTCHVRLNI